jgi:DNA-binding transcriptional LysR family regulator
MDIELRYLRYFVAVAEELHFGRAAARLIVSQPALSRQIRELERELGTELLARTSRQVRLTPAGEILLHEARLTLAQSDRTIEAARRASRGELGTLTIGYLGSVALSHLPMLVRAFRVGRPEVVLRFYDGIDDKQLQGIEEGHLDIGFVRSPGRHVGVQVEPIDREPLTAVLPADHRLADRESIPIAALADTSLILWQRSLSASVYDEIIAASRRAGFTPRIEIESTGALGTFGLVAAGLGASILVGAYRQLQPPGVSFVPIEGLGSTLYMAWRPANRSPTLAAFLALVRSSCPTLDGGPFVEAHEDAHGPGALPDDPPGSGGVCTYPLMTKPPKRQNSSSE